MAKYEQVPTDEDLALQRLNDPTQGVKQWLPWICHALLLSLSLILFLASIRERTPCLEAESSRIHQSSDTNIYSPAQPAIEYTTRRFNGSLNFRSVYKGTPRKELDDAWHALSPGAILPGPTLAISVEELKLIGKDSTADATVQIPAEFGGGYYATLEVFHQLHCLNLVRMATYKEHYDHEHAFGDRKSWYRPHVDHCIDMLRQRLMCTADIGLVTGLWVEHYGEPYPDFSTRHQCRNFEKVQEWAKKHELNVSMEEIIAVRGSVNMTKPPE